MSEQNKRPYLQKAIDLIGAVPKASHDSKLRGGQIYALIEIAEQLERLASEVEQLNEHALNLSDTLISVERLCLAMGLIPKRGQ